MTLDAAALYLLAARALTGELSSAVALDEALATARPTELLKLSTVVREPWRRPEPWPSIELWRALSLDPAVPRDVALLCAASLDRNGILREASVRSLRMSVAPYARRFLWMRLDDVVSAIALLADEALSNVARTPDALVADIALLDQLAARERARTRPSLVAAMRALKSKGARAALQVGLASNDAEVRSSCARRLANEGDDAVRIEALLIALRDPSPRVHLWAAREAALRKTSASVAFAVAPAMCAHEEPSVRLRGVRILVRADDAHEALLAATIDVDASVRFAARAAVVRGGAFDYRAVALGALSEEAPDVRRVLGALGAMYDVGERDDWRLVSQYLAHPLVRVRAEALRALTSLAPELFVDVFVGALRQKSRRVAREGVAALERCAVSLGDAAFRTAVPDATLREISGDATLRDSVRIAARRFLKARRERA